jgi:hypothetical protein
MLNPNIEIKKWFITHIASATSLQVFDGFAPDLNLKEYIVLDGRTSTQEQGKSGYTNTNTIVVDIVTKNANFGYKRSEEISNLILTAINSDTKITLPSGWTSTSLYVASITNLDGLNPLDNVFRTIITYNLTITQI